jgi:adenine/guanine/hypoxanthine permease
VSAISTYFQVERHGSTVRAEIVGGVTTFMTMAYILFVNPSILGDEALGEQALAFPAVLTVTALVSAVATIAMGLAARYPFAVAPGMGLNAFVAFTLVLGMGLTMPEAMGVVLVSGVVLTILVLTGFREAVLHAIPMPLKRAIGVGIGLFIAVIGLDNGGLIVAGEGTLLDLGDLTSPTVALFVGALALAFTLVARAVKGGLLIAILVATAAGILLNELAFDGGLWEAPGVGEVPEQVVGLPDFSLIGAFSLDFVTTLGVVAAVIAVFSVLLSDFFDTVGTAIGLGAEGGFLTEDGQLPRMRELLTVDGAAAAVGGALSTSSCTTYIESGSGIAEGARTGLASMVTGVLFLAAMFLSPLAGVIPPEATATALVVVGYLMIQGIRHISWTDPTDAVPAFLTLIGMPLTWSIADGIGLGFVSFVVLKLLTGRTREVPPLMWVSAAAFAIYFTV